ncbi:MAG TPA: T9SS type A sorting domain-containing protein [Saprospiraceae bacterium]|nr:T9SS type A sorting domain-containing protein [Saprospiraceae bacterium]HMQ84230.1 T9SS type A sorting domain-containing protein [Saprospiraceae bacterium]
MSLLLKGQVEFCYDFNDGIPAGQTTTLDNWIGVLGSMQYSNAGSIAGSSDYYLRAYDAAGGSFIYNTLDYQGNWINQENSEDCFCYDFIMINNGTGLPNTPNTLQIFQGANPTTATLRAVFQTTIALQQGDPWVRICPPVSLANPDGSLPSNAEGQWVMVVGTPADWNTLITNVSGVQFGLDIPGGGPTEIYGYDNICLENCESECGAIINDSIPGYSCELPGQSFNYSFNFENATPYNVTSVVINGITPAGTTISPQFFNYYFSPIPANGGVSPTETVTIQLPGPITAPTTVCFDVIYLTDTTECCHYEHCITLEPVDPCELVEVQALETEVDCCYEIGLINNFCPDYFTGIQTELLTPGVSFDAYGGTGWTATPNGDESIIDWTQTGALPLGALNNIGFCFKDVLSATQVPQQVAVHWLALDANGEQVIVCSDTLEFNCEPCLSITGEVLCDDNGGYVYNFTITNNDPTHTASLIVFESHTAGVSFVPASIPVTLAPNGSYSGSVVITGGTPGQMVEFKVLLFDPSGWCCHLDDVMITLPDCNIDPDPCDCGDQEEFNQAVQAGFSADRDCATGIAMLIANALESCDQVSWRVTNTETNETITGVTDGVTPFFFDFMGSVTYQVRMVVTRLDAQGLNCFPGVNAVFTGTTVFDCLGPISPGPVSGILLRPIPAKEDISVYAPEDGLYQLIIYNTNGQKIQQFPAELYRKQGFNMSISELPAGLYLLQLEHDNGMLYQEKFVKMD